MRDKRAQEKKKKKTSTWTYQRRTSIAITFFAALYLEAQTALSLVSYADRYLLRHLERRRVSVLLLKLRMSINVVFMTTISRYRNIYWCRTLYDPDFIVIALPLYEMLSDALCSSIFGWSWYSSALQGSLLLGQVRLMAKFVHETLQLRSDLIWFTCSANSEGIYSGNSSWLWIHTS